MINQMKRWFRSISISRKLLLSNLLTIVLPLVFVFFFVSYSLIDLTSRQFMDSTSKTLDQTAGYISYKLSGAARITNIATYDPEKYLMISQDPKNYSLPDQLFDAWRLTNFMDSLRFMDRSLRFHLYVNDDLYYANEEVLFFPLSHIADAQWFKDMSSKGLPLIWLPSGMIDSNLDKPDLNEPAAVEALSVVRRMIDLRAINETLAVLRVDVSIKDIETILGNAVISDDSSVWLINEEGMILAASVHKSESGLAESTPLSIDEAVISEEAPPSLFQPTVDQFKQVIGQSGWEEIGIDGQQFLVSSVAVVDTPMHIVAALPKSVPLRQSDRLRLVFFLILLAVMAVVLFVSLRFTQSIASRLKSISERMHWVHKGVMEPITLDKRDDEIGDLAKTYNFMISRINQLAEERYERGRDALRQEMRALQGQINPHFLYNMLDLINLSALDKGMPDLAELVRMLARFYRLGLSRGRDTVTIQDELEHVSLFFRMQNRRFGERIHYKIDFPEEEMSHQILKIILQPIVENSVLHGILSKRDGRGNIWITGRLSETHIFFDIRDDGVGIGTDKLANLLHSEGEGYGLYNVNRRLCVFYGDEAGLEIKSIQGGGTTVQFKIPRLPSNIG